MTEQLIAMMTGMEFYYYSCSVCHGTIIAIRPHTEPIQCSKECKEYLAAQDKNNAKLQFE